MKSSPDISVLLPDEATLRARREALISEVQHGGPGRRGPVRARRTLIAIAALLVLSGGAALAAGVFSADDIAVDAGVGCYDRASLHASVTVTHAAADPVAKCARFWNEGVVDVDAPPGAPHLVACTGAGQPVRVFPGPGVSVCRRLGLVPLPADYASAGAAHARAYAAFYTLEGVPSPDSNCPSPQAQADFARAQLSGKYKGVEVVIEGGEPCGGGYELAGERIVVGTVSRGRARVNRLHISRRRDLARVEAALVPIFGSPPRYRRTRARCLAPDEFAGEVRRTLANAGFPGVEVSVEGDGECVSTGARYNTCCWTADDDGASFLAAIRTMTRAEWKADKAAARYWKVRRSSADLGLQSGPASSTAR